MVAYSVRRALRPRWTLIHTGVALGLLGSGTGWFYHANIDPVVSIPTPSMPAVNARDDYIRAVEMLVDTAKIDEAIHKPQDQKPEGHVFTLDEKECLVAANEPALAAMKAGFSKPFLTPPVRGFDAVFPEIGKYCKLARVCHLKSVVLAEKGDYAGAVDTSLDATRLGLDVPRGGVLIHELVGISCQAIGDRPIWGWIDHLDANSARAMARRLEAMEATRIPFVQSLQEESLCGKASLMKLMRGQNTVQMAWWMFKELNWQDQFSGKRVVFAASMVRYNKSEILDNYSRYMATECSRDSLPWGQELVAPPVPEPTDPINRLICPIFAQARIKDAMSAMESRLLIASLALRAYRLQHGGANPDSLQALVKEGIITSVPNDPYGMTLDAPLGYRRLANGSCRLYSVGPDAMDNGGKAIDNRKTGNRALHRNWPEADDKGDWVAWVDTPAVNRD